MTRARWAIGVAVALALCITLFGPVVLRPEVRVEPGRSLQEAIDSAPSGARLELAAGVHEGPVVVDKPLELTSVAGASLEVSEHVEAALSVVADDVRIAGLTIIGGDTGIRVREVEGVSLHRVTVRDARYHGIEAIDATVRISAADVSGLRDELAQGIEIRNSDGRPDSLIEGSTVRGGQEGIVSHVSEVLIRDNTVRDTTLRGITITEMSDGLVHGNTVEDAAGVGLYCGDMSRCEFRSNRVDRVAANPLSRATAGWGLVVTYHSAASSTGDLLAGAAGPVFTSIDGELRDRTPFELGAGAAALRPVTATVLVTLVLMALLFALTKRAALSLGRASDHARDPAPWIVPVAMAGLGVQTFHMIEHWLQVFRVRFDGLPSRGGLVGPAVEAEWVHFIYNGLVLLGLVAVVAACRRGWRPPGRDVIGDRFLVLAVAIQGYHMVEHSLKLTQHITGGAKVNPGLAGHFIDLVLLHFGINLAVYVACIGAAVMYATASRRREVVAGAPGYAAFHG